MQRTRLVQRLTRPAAVAGLFYPGDAAELGGMVDELLAEVPADKIDRRRPKALIVPHAGYIYSGPVAASAYAQLKPWASSIERVVLVGPPHRYPVPRLASSGATAFATPLGELVCDPALVGAERGVEELPRAHEREHSLEVQLPFLQRVVPGARIVPMLAGHAGARAVGEVLEALWGGPETLVIASSDLTHYLPYEQGRAIDAATASRIVSLDESPIEGELACGAAAINGLLWVARRKAMTCRLIDLRSSGDTAGTRDRVVGYGAFVLHERGRDDHAH